ncbi:MAG TPA: potassium channel family protein [Gaiellaceae bacterium]|nr:potassium channel family protein [Gaiellaceae bacterium]
MTESGGRPIRAAGRRMRNAAHPGNLIERRMSKFLREPPSVRLAVSVIVTATMLVVVVGGVLMRVVDHPEYPSIWLGMWWVLQTVTTVGFGDLTPTTAVGRILTSLVMLYGIAFLAITTAAITSVFVARAQQERALGEEDAEAPVIVRLIQVDEQLARLTDQTRQLNERLEQLLPKTGGD